MKSIKITQPILVQSLEDEFKLLIGTPPQTSANSGTVLTKNKEEDKLSKDMHTKYQDGIGKFQHLVLNS